MTSRTERLRRPLAAMFLLFALVAAACGSRVPHEEALAVATGGRTGDDRFTVGDDGGVEETGGEFLPDDVGGSEGGSTGTVGGDGGTTADRQGATGPGGGGSGSQGGESSGQDGDPGGDEGSEGQGGGPKAAIKIGMVGTFSGVVGAAAAPSRDSFQAWVRMINDRGGVNGHPVQLFVGDTGGDASRDLVLARDFIENRGAIALVHYWPSGGAMPSVVKYAESKNIPIIGGATYESGFYKSPVAFPQTTGFQNWYHSHAKAMVDRKLTKVAIVYCTESAVCEVNARTFRKQAEPMGIEIVYEGRTSLAQPDFTSECLNARSAGATVYYPVLDGNSANRLARSCARQNYEPAYFVQAPQDPPDPALEGAFGTVPAFPWMMKSGNAALDEYGQAMAKYAGDSTGNSFASFGWLSAKLFEKAAANVSDTPTSQDLFEGLWAVQGETLGGLAPSLSYKQGQPAPEPNCAFYVEVKDGKWTAPRGLDLVGCRR